MNTFFIWIDTEVKANGWTYAELARRAKKSPGSISNTMNGHNVVTWDFCAAIAMAFGLPPETVFKEAGLLPKTKESTTLEHLVDVAEKLDEEKLGLLANIADVIYQRQQEGK